ncbi:polysaccharide biosynthesis protein [Ferrimonas sediminicola]|uniref:Polysaccharide biosynthesis protein n=1 Tax=Ferrimonas sediminicola TaxID=2569538 RepID=A0A4V6WML2_9GAMM|nr:nucleoside-diphosphate sugar epimerase/dehydratase [Ferrimonas sediminicola]TKB46461.1 polysaccharide biosynthesis protein [Ferrimonas sediminicola]
MRIFSDIWNLSRTTKKMISVIIDIISIIVSFTMSVLVLNEFQLQVLSNINIFALAIVTLVTVVSCFLTGLYKTVVRFLTFQALGVIALNVLISSFATLCIISFHGAQVSSNVVFVYFSFLLILLVSTRLLVRMLAIYLLQNRTDNVLIYGAGSAGRQLALSLKQSAKLRCVGFVDKDTTIFNTVILGVRVFSTKCIDRLVAKHSVSKVLLAVPSLSRSERKIILEALEPLPVEVLTVPSIKEILEGEKKIDDLKEVSIEDLLGRDAVEPQESLMKANIQGKVVLVTGAGGSIGSELCRQIVQQAPRKIILFDVSEFALYKIDREISAYVNEKKLNVDVLPLIGSVQKEKRLHRIMDTFGVQTVYHAAAYKHVPLVEYNVVEGVRNNVFGTYFCARAAINSSVETFVLISTDKAVRPTNVMGATKRMAELGLQALADEVDKGDIKFSMVRFGNVLGSSGSVIPLFKKQIKMGGPVTVTDKEITRYFMTIPEAAQLVIQAGAMGKGGDVFVLDMGSPVKIIDLARKMIKLSGLEVKDEDNPRGDVEIEVTGLRPGEKLYEELLIGDENVNSTFHKRILTANERFISKENYEKILEKLDCSCKNFEYEEIIELLVSAPTDFNSKDGLGDLLWKQSNSCEDVIA